MQMFNKGGERTGQQFLERVESPADASLVPSKAKKRAAKTL
jgi:hypothetical protein